MVVGHCCAEVTLNPVNRPVPRCGAWSVLWTQRRLVPGWVGAKVTHEACATSRTVAEQFVLSRSARHDVWIIEHVWQTLLRSAHNVLVEQERVANVLHIPAIAGDLHGAQLTTIVLLHSLLVRATRTLRWDEAMRIGCDSVVQPWDGHCTVVCIATQKVEANASRRLDQEVASWVADCAGIVTHTEASRCRSLERCRTVEGSGVRLSTYVHGIAERADEDASIADLACAIVANRTSRWVGDKMTLGIPSDEAVDRSGRGTDDAIELVILNGLDGHFCKRERVDCVCAAGTWSDAHHAVSLVHASLEQARDVYVHVVLTIRNVHGRREGSVASARDGRAAGEVQRDGDATNRRWNGGDTNEASLGRIEALLICDGRNGLDSEVRWEVSDRQIVEEEGASGPTDQDTALPARRVRSVRGAEEQREVSGTDGTHVTFDLRALYLNSITLANCVLHDGCGPGDSGIGPSDGP